MRLRHMSIDMNFFKTSRLNELLCDSCKTNKMKKISSRRSQNFVYQKNECIDSNLMKSFNFTIFNDFRYAILFTCRDIERI